MKHEGFCGENKLSFIQDLMGIMDSVRSYFLPKWDRTFIPDRFWRRSSILWDVIGK